MCFIRSSKAAYQQEVQEPVVRHEADASATKNSNQSISSGYRENLKTSPIGLTDEANIKKKTLLGE